MEWSSDVCSSELFRRYVVGAATSSQKHRGKRMTWTNDRVAELMRLWEAGRSASEIGRLLGVSKNSVVGKAYRMKLQARPSPIKRGSAPQVRRVAVAAIRSEEHPSELQPIIRISYAVFCLTQNKKTNEYTQH